MSMFGNLTAGYIREAIEKEIKNIGTPQTDKEKGILEGLEKAKSIAEDYEH